jgi:RNA polymerase sigma factor (sigma-70 family)
LRVATDAHLVALTRQGRSAAFEAIYDRHSRSIFSFCRHMLGSAEEAEDAVQHTFLAAYNALTGSETPIHLRAWLFTIARNRCYSMLRSRREHPVAELDEQPTEGLATLVQRRQDLRDLVVDLQQLPTAQREALVLAEMDALSHEQIAAVLGVPREKVKALVYQARESLLASRAARETDCAEIREQLANLHGGALRRTNLRRHLRECAGCREFRHSIDRQRRHLQMIVPVLPTLALKELVLGTTVGGGAAAGVAGGGVLGGGVLATSALKGGMLKGVLGAVVAAMGTAGTIVAVRDLPQLVGVDLFHSTHRLAPSSPALGLRVTGHQPGAATGRVAAATTLLAERGSSVHSTSAVLSVLTPLPPKPKHAGGARRVQKLSHAVRPSSAGQGKQAPLAAPAAPAPATTAPYLGSSAYGGGAQTSGGGTRGGGYSSSGTRSGSSTTPRNASAIHGDGGSGATMPSSSGASSSSGGTSRGSTAQSGSGASAATLSGSAAAPPATAPSAGTAPGTAGGGSSGTGDALSGAGLAPSSGGGAWSGGAGGAGGGSHGR